MAGILIVDDDPIFCTPLARYIEKLGHRCHVAETFAQGLRMADDYSVDIVLLDVILPDANGLDRIEEFVAASSSPELIIITGKSEMSGAEMALKNGAWDYLEKPPSYDDLALALKRALRFRKNKTESHALEDLDADFIVGQDIKLRKCMDTVSKAIRTKGNLLVSGETGTGKDLVAKAVHMNSGQAESNFVTVDCTNLPDNLVESILFGYSKGSFTGAVAHREGLIRQADKGTLFLDEVGDLPESAQKSILRVLQTKTYRPLGSKKEISCDFRLVSATNRNLKKMVDQGRFRRDLYYRLVTYHVQLPALRERPGDINLLTRHYVRRICEQFGIRCKTVSRDFVENLLLYDWKGNIRELINVLHSSIANAMNEPALNPHHLPVEIRINCRQKRMEARKTFGQGIEGNLAAGEAAFPCLKEFRLMNEAQYLESLMKLTKGDIEKACQISGTSRSGLYHLLKKHRPTVMHS